MDQLLERHRDHLQEDRRSQAAKDSAFYAILSEHQRRTEEALEAERTSIWKRVGVPASTSLAHSFDYCPSEASSPSRAHPCYHKGSASVSGATQASAASTSAPAHLAADTISHASSNARFMEANGGISITTPTSPHQPESEYGTPLPPGLLCSRRLTHSSVPPLMEYERGAADPSTCWSGLLTSPAVQLHVIADDGNIVLTVHQVALLQSPYFRERLKAPCVGMPPRAVDQLEVQLPPGCSARTMLTICQWLYSHHNAKFEVADLGIEDALTVVAVAQVAAMLLLDSLLHGLSELMHALLSTFQDQAYVEEHCTAVGLPAWFTAREFDHVDRSEAEMVQMLQCTSSFSTTRPQAEADLGLWPHSASEKGRVAAAALESLPFLSVDGHLDEDSLAWLWRLAEYYCFCAASSSTQGYDVNDPGRSAAGREGTHLQSFFRRLAVCSGKALSVDAVRYLQGIYGHYLERLSRSGLCEELVEALSLCALGWSRSAVPADSIGARCFGSAAGVLPRLLSEAGSAKPSIINVLATLPAAILVELLSADALHELGEADGIILCERLAQEPTLILASNWLRAERLASAPAYAQKAFSAMATRCVSFQTVD